MTQYIVEKPDGSDRQVAADLAMYPGWSVLAEFEGDLPDFHDIVGGAVVPDLAAYKADASARVTALKVAKQGGTAATSFGVVQNDDRSKLMMNGAATRALGAKIESAAFSVEWRLADNSTVTLTADQMIQMGREASAFDNSVQQYADGLKAQIDAATTLDGLSAIDLEAGWPS